MLILIYNLILHTKYLNAQYLIINHQCACTLVLYLFISCWFHFHYRVHFTSAFTMSISPLALYDHLGLFISYICILRNGMRNNFYLYKHCLFNLKSITSVTCNFGFVCNKSAVVFWLEITSVGGFDGEFCMILEFYDEAIWLVFTADNWAIWIHCPVLAIGTWNEIMEILLH